ncbi:MAG: thermonuclease family protein [Cyanobacteria bacterium P01_F01_bin.86]
MPLFASHPISFSESQRLGRYRAFCVHVVDGDTFDIILDLGIMQYSVIAVRLLGVNTPELNASNEIEREQAKAARDRVQQLIFEQPLLISTYKDRRSFGRYVAAAWFHPNAEFQARIADLDTLQSNDFTQNWVSLSSVLIYEGHAREL